MDKATKTYVYRCEGDGGHEYQMALMVGAPHRKCHAENERLQASVDSHNEQLRIQTERAVAAEDEVERLRTKLRQREEQFRWAKRYKDENERLRAVVDAFRHYHTDPEQKVTNYLAVARALETLDRDKCP